MSLHSPGSVIANAIVVFNTQSINQMIVGSLFRRNAQNAAGNLELNMAYSTSETYCHSFIPTCYHVHVETIYNGCLFFASFFYRGGREERWSVINMYDRKQETSSRGEAFSSNHRGMALQHLDAHWKKWDDKINLSMCQTLTWTPEPILPTGVCV